MPTIPEDLLQAIMKMSGMSRDEAEKTLNKAVSEMTAMGGATRRPAGVNTTRKSAKKYTREKYPHFQKSASVLKYTLRVTLKGLKPAIWRKFEVPSDITLRHLGDMILELMGWENYHLNQFIKGNDCYMPLYQRDASGEDAFDWRCNNYSQEDYSIADLLQEKGKSITFEYDFGDSWEHEVKLSSIAEYGPLEACDVKFVGGEGACPPEDCGGIWGYEELLGILGKRKARKRLTSEEKERLEWAGWDADYNPSYLNVEFCKEIAEGFSR